MEPGHIRVVSKRKGGIVPRSDEFVVNVDRSHPVLGNRHILNNHLDDDERDQVIDAYEVDLRKDMTVKGPMFRALLELSVQVSNGKHLALCCWCAPRKCHAELLAVEIAEMAHIDYTPPALYGDQSKKKQMGLF